MFRITEESGRLIWNMQQDSARKEPYTAEELSEVNGDMFICAFGAIIGRDAKYYSLFGYAMHGVISAALFPELAEEYGIAQPLDKPPLGAYQEFEIACRHLMPTIRISCRFTVNIQWGRCENWPNMDQITALRQWLKAQDIINDKINTEFGTLTGHEVLMLLYKGEIDPEYNTREAQQAIATMEADPERFKAFDPKEWGYV